MEEGKVSSVNFRHESSWQKCGRLSDQVYLKIVVKK